MDGRGSPKRLEKDTSYIKGIFAILPKLNIFQLLPRFHSNWATTGRRFAHPATYPQDITAAYYGFTSDCRVILLIVLKSY